MDPRPLTVRERAVLEALLTSDLQDAELLRSRATDVTVVGGCPCGCPSVDFVHGRGRGMAIPVNATVRGSHDGLFLWTIEHPERGLLLGGIEWVGVTETDPAELPPPDLLDIEPT